MEKIRVGVIYGGKSTEHEISLLSAKGIIEHLNPDNYQLEYIYIDREGHWHRQNQKLFSSLTGNPKNAAEGEELVFSLGNAQHSLRRAMGGDPISIDVAFPILHGTYGEDGCIQGLLRMAEIPFVGADVAGSAIGMDKIISKRLLQQAKISTAKCVTIHSSQNWPDYDQVAQNLGEILFIKPCKQGSSVGISKVSEKQQWQAALESAFQYDDAILVEEFIEGQEIEVSVLGNDEPKASLPGEIVPNDDFYSYDAKYIDADGARLVIPAKLPKDVIESIRALAIKTYVTLSCQGMTRVDFFVQNNKLFVNEINTIPGFTPISMYPKLWEASGVPMASLIDQLIQLALERYKRQAKMQRNFDR